MYTAAVGDQNPPIPLSARLHRRRLRNADSVDGGRPSLGHHGRSTRLHYGARATHTRLPAPNINNSTILFCVYSPKFYNRCIYLETPVV